MSNLRAILAAAFLCAPAAPAAAQAKLDERPHVTATGTCVADVVPDRAALTVTVTRQGLDAARVSADAVSAFNAFRRDVEALRLPDAVLAGSGLSLQRNLDASGPRPVFRGYVANAVLHVESSDPARLAEVVPLAAGSRIEDVGEISLMVSDAGRRAAELGCLPRASADARARAAALVEGLSLALGPVLLVGDVRQGVRPPRLAPAAARAAAATPGQAPDVPLGVQRIEVTATVTFALGSGALGVGKP